jgi:hypothetical protein
LVVWLARSAQVGVWLRQIASGAQYQSVQVAGHVGEANAGVISTPAGNSHTRRLNIATMLNLTEPGRIAWSRLIFGYEKAIIKDANTRRWKSKSADALWSFGRL